MYIFNKSLPIAIGSDHAGFDCKEDLISFLEGENMEFKDFGTYNKDSVDYPDFAHPVASAVENGEASFGILLCGSANGVAIAANKHAGIRAAICWG
ncbi:MAG: RpiB/LacA/LacB family sugar-phosphate isomerase, partial [Chitinophagaceae bacterium]